MRLVLRYAARSLPTVASRIGPLTRASVVTGKCSRLAWSPSKSCFSHWRAFSVYHGLREAVREQDQDEGNLSQFKQSCE